MKKFKLLRGYVRPNTQNVELDIQREITSRILRQSRVMISVMNRHGYGGHIVVSPELARRLIGITEE